MKGEPRKIHCSLARMARRDARPTGARICDWAFWTFSLLRPSPTPFVEEPESPLGTKRPNEPSPREGSGPKKSFAKFLLRRAGIQELKIASKRYSKFFDPLANDSCKHSRHSRNSHLTRSSQSPQFPSNQATSADDARGIEGSILSWMRHDEFPHWF